MSIAFDDPFFNLEVFDLLTSFDDIWDDLCRHVAKYWTIGPFLFRQETNTFLLWWSKSSYTNYKEQHAKITDVLNDITIQNSEANNFAHELTCTTLFSW